MAKDNAMEALGSGSRKCTDIPIFLLFIAFGVGALAVFGAALEQGDPNRLLYGMDYKFDQCGIDNSGNPAEQTVTDDQGTDDTSDDKTVTVKVGRMDQTERKLLYYVQPPTSASDPSMVGICVKECPTENSATFGYCTGKLYGRDDNDKGQVELAKLVTEYAADQSKPNPADLIPLMTGCNKDSDPDSIECTTCYPMYKTKKVLNFCAPDMSATDASNIAAAAETANITAAYNIDSKMVSATLEFLADPGAAFSNMMGDLMKAIPVLIISAFISIVLGFVWLVLLKMFAAPMIWATVIGLLLVLAGTTGMVYNRSQTMPTDTDAEKDQQQTLTIVSYILMVVTAVYLLILICMCKKIRMAVAVLKEACNAMMAIKALIFVPILPALLQVGVTAVFMVISFYIASAGTLKVDGQGFGQLEYDDTLKGMFAYEFFGYLWCVTLLVHLGNGVVIGAVLQWYWKGDGGSLGMKPILDSAGRILKYHFGSFCLGSLIVAIVKFIQYLMYYIEKNQGKLKDNKVVKVVWCCIHCCLECFKKTLEFISKMAYIQVLMRSCTFCKGAKNAFKLIMSNAARLAAMTLVSKIFLGMGKWFVCFLSAFIAWNIMEAWKDLDINFRVMPTMMVALLGYVIGSVFMDVFDMTIDTIFQSFCVDEEETQGKYAADKSSLGSLVKSGGGGNKVSPQQ